MAPRPAVLNRFIGKLRAAMRLFVVMSRFALHPADFLRLYQRESTVADSVLDIAVLSLEQEFQERIAALEARVAELEALQSTIPQPAE